MLRDTCTEVLHSAMARIMPRPPRLMPTCTPAAGQHPCTAPLPQLLLCAAQAVGHRSNTTSCPGPAPALIQPFLPLRCRCGGCGYPTSLHACRVGMPVGVLVLCAVECRGLPPGWQRHVREECCVLAGLARAQCACVPRRQRCPHQVPAGQQASVQVVAWQVCLQCWVGGLASWVHLLLPPTCLTALASQTRCAALLSVCRRA